MKGESRMNSPESDERLEQERPAARRPSPTPCSMPRGSRSTPCPSALRGGSGRALAACSHRRYGQPPDEAADPQPECLRRHLAGAAVSGQDAAALAATLTRDAAGLPAIW